MTQVKSSESAGGSRSSTPELSVFLLPALHISVFSDHLCDVAGVFYIISLQTPSPPRRPTCVWGLVVVVRAALALQSPTLSLVVVAPKDESFTDCLPLPLMESSQADNQPISCTDAESTTAAPTSNDTASFGFFTKVSFKGPVHPKKDH